jgi:hypothetical protein
VQDPSAGMAVFNEGFEGLEGLEGCWGRGGKRGGRAQGHRIIPRYGDRVLKFVASRYHTPVNWAS